MNYIYVFLLFLAVNIVKGQNIVAKNQLRYVYGKDTVIHTFNRDVLGKQKYVIFKSQNDDNGIKASNIICFYDDIGILDKLGGSLMGVEKSKGEYFYFSSPIVIYNKQDSIYFLVKERYLYKSQRKAISRMNTGKKADTYSNDEMVYSGRITSKYMYLTCEGKGCERKLFVFEKSYESEIKSDKR